MSQAHLLKIPLELKHQIFDELFLEQPLPTESNLNDIALLKLRVLAPRTFSPSRSLITNDIPYSRPFSCNVISHSTHRKPPVALLLTCRQLYLEALGYFYKYATLTFPIQALPLAEYPIRQVKPYLQQIKKIEILLDGDVRVRADDWDFSRQQYGVNRRLRVLSHPVEDSVSTLFTRRTHSVAALKNMQLRLQGLVSMINQHASELQSITVSLKDPIEQFDDPHIGPPSIWIAGVKTIKSIFCGEDVLDSLERLEGRFDLKFGTAETSDEVERGFQKALAELNGRHFFSEINNHRG